MIFRETQEEMKKLTNQRLIKIFEFLLTHTADKQLIIWSDEQSRLWNEIKNRLTQKDAIPIEWIREQLKKEKYRTFLVDYIEWGDCLRWLIDEWEKENETN